MVYSRDWLYESLMDLDVYSCAKGLCCALVGDICEGVILCVVGLEGSEDINVDV